MRSTFLLPPFLLLLAGCSMEFPEDYGLAPEAEDPEGVDPRTTAAITDVDLAARNSGVEALRGRWAVDSSWCEDPGRGRVIEITDGRSANRSNTPQAGAEEPPGCRVVDLVDDGAGNFTGPLACTVEGVRSSELVRITPSGDTITLSYLGGTDPETTLQRC